MSRAYIDFNAVPEEHKHIDARLVNWGRWCQDSVALQICPMFRGVPAVPPEKRAEARRQLSYTQLGHEEKVNGRDAATIHVAVLQLPSQHRSVLNWVYVRPWLAPAKACKVIGTSLMELGRLLTDSRQMLIAKGV